VDFGLAIVARDSNSLESTVEDQGATARYTAPEILKGVANHSKESDVFAFGMVMVEVGANESIPRKGPYPLVQAFTGKVPFSGFRSATAVAAITAGDRPKRPTHPSFTDHLWVLTRWCWVEGPQERPGMDQVLKQLSVFPLSNDEHPIHWQPQKC